MSEVWVSFCCPIYNAYFSFSFKSHFSFENRPRKNDRKSLFSRKYIKSKYIWFGFGLLRKILHTFQILSLKNIYIQISTLFIGKK